MSVRGNFPQGWGTEHETLFVALTFVLETLKPKAQRRAIDRLAALRVLGNESPTSTIDGVAPCIAAVLPRVCMVLGCEMPAAE